MNASHPSTKTLRKGHSDRNFSFDFSQHLLRKVCTYPAVKQWTASIIVPGDPSGSCPRRGTTAVCISLGHFSRGYDQKNSRAPNECRLARDNSTHRRTPEY